MKREEVTKETKPEKSDFLLRIPEVLQKVNISRATLDKLRRAGKFPPGVKLAPKTIAWRASEIDAWLESLPEYSIATGQPAANGGRA